MYPVHDRIAGLDLSVVLGATLLLAACQSNPSTNGSASTELNSTEQTESQSAEPIYSENSTATIQSGYANPQKIGIITDKRLSEISGLAVSNLDRDTLWAINDSGHDPELYALDRNGSLRTVYKMGVENRDWESLASFNLNGEALLLLADSGDNLAVHDSYRLHLIAEPIKEPRQDTTNRVPLLPIATINFRYPNGPRNCEAVSVSEADSQIVLITKQEGKREVYTLPLQLETPQIIETASYEGTLAGIPQSLTDILAGQLANVDLSQVTGLEIDSAGNAYLLTYRGVYQWTKTTGMTWGASFAEVPDVLLKHNLRQAEAIAYSRQTGELFYTSERLPAPIWRYSP